MRLQRRVEAPPAAVDAALLDAASVQRWTVPEGRTSDVHAFDAREGGASRISLAYDDPAAAGRTRGATDTFSGRFARPVPDREVVQVVAFETDDPALRGLMTITYMLEEDGGGTLVTGRHDDLPPGV